MERVARGVWQALYAARRASCSVTIAAMLVRWAMVLPARWCQSILTSPSTKPSPDVSSMRNRSDSIASMDGCGTASNADSICRARSMGNNRAMC